MLPLIALASSDDATPDELRKALAAHDQKQIARNGHHLIQALQGSSDLGIASMKFACIHEALGNQFGVLWAPMSSSFSSPDGKFLRLTDEQACRFVTYMLDVLRVKTFPGLIFMACRFGWPDCARLLKSRGIYAPLPWQGYSGDTDEDRLRLAEILLTVVQPSVDDMKLISSTFKEGEPAAVKFKDAIANASRLH